MASRAEWERKIWNVLYAHVWASGTEELLEDLQGVFLSETEWERIGAAREEVAARLDWLSRTPEERKKITTRSRSGGPPRRRSRL